VHAAVVAWQGEGVEGQVALSGGTDWGRGKEEGERVICLYRRRGGVRRVMAVCSGTVAAKIRGRY
jgi:hypothetical protein